MYRLQVWENRHWKWGIRTYNTLEEAVNRAKQLATVGIKARPKLSSELFN